MNIQDRYQVKIVNKAAVRKFFWFKNNPKSIFEKVHNQPVFKTMPYFSPIHNG